MEAYLKEMMEGKIDFEGQRSVDAIHHYALIVNTGLAFIVGAALQSLALSMYTFAGGLLLILAITIPPWPMYNKHPVTWLEAKKSK